MAWQLLYTKSLTDVNLISISEFLDLFLGDNEQDISNKQDPKKYKL